jgi:hypothetical protein
VWPKLHPGPDTNASRHTATPHNPQTLNKALFDVYLCPTAPTMPTSRFQRKTAQSRTLAPGVEQVPSCHEPYFKHVVPPAPRAHAPTTTQTAPRS